MQGSPRNRNAEFEDMLEHERSTTTAHDFPVCRSPIPSPTDKQPALNSEVLRSPVAPGNKMFRFISGDRHTPAAGSAAQSPFQTSPVGSDVVANHPSTSASPRRYATSCCPGDDVYNVLWSELCNAVIVSPYLASSAPVSYTHLTLPTKA